MKVTSDAAALGFGGGRPVSNRTLRKFRARRRVAVGYPWDGRFETREEVSRYFSGDRIVCLLCGRAMRRLSMHLPRIHGVSEDDYRTRYGLPASRGLTCEASHAAYSEASSAPERVARIASLSRVAQPLAAAAVRRGEIKPKPTYAIAEAQERFVALHGGERLGPDAYEAFLARIAAGRTPREVAKDPDMPSLSMWRNYCRDHREFDERFRVIWESLPFTVQARAQMLGARFEQEVRALFDKGLSDHRIAERLGVTSMSVNRRTRVWRAAEVRDTP